MTTRIAGVVALMMTLPVGAAGQSPARQSAAEYVDTAGGVSLDDAVAQALEHEPSLRTARLAIDVARGERLQAGLRPNPLLSFGQQSEPGGTDKQTRLEMQWPLDLFRRTGRVRVAEQELAVAQHGFADRERQLAADVRIKYGEVSAAARVLSITDDLLAATTRQQTLVGARVDAGAATPLDRNLLRVEVQRLEADRASQSGALDRAMLELKRLLGVPVDAPFKIRDSLEALIAGETAPADSDMSQRAARRGDVLQAEARVGAARAEVDRAKREGRPDVSLVGGYMRMDAGFPQRGFDDLGVLQPVHGIFHYFSAGAVVTVPLLNRNQGAVAAADARRLAAEAGLESTRLTAQSEIAASRSRDEHARAALAAYTSDARGLARENLAVVRQTYDLGRVTLFDVLNEQRRYLDVELAYTAALREAYEARQALKAALGEVR
jgi:cobalt-zinc-cadmium efflux system outer membrane protein